LIKIFICRGCTAAEDMADETINRVAGRVHEIMTTYMGNPALYFYGVADKIFHEHMRKAPAVSPVLPSASTEESELKYGCLEQCMQGISAESRAFILAYYGTGDSDARTIDQRKDLAERTGVGASMLWLRAHRIRESLRKCVAACVQRGTVGQIMKDARTKGYPAQSQ